MPPVVNQMFEVMKNRVGFGRYGNFDAWRSAWWRVVCVQVVTIHDRTRCLFFWFVLEKDKSDDFIALNNCFLGARA